jgi:hypothetical protein
MFQIVCSKYIVGVSQAWGKEGYRVLLNEMGVRFSKGVRVLSARRHKQPLRKFKSTSDTVHTSRDLSIYRYTHPTNLKQKFNIQTFTVLTTSIIFKTVLIRTGRLMLYNLELSLPYDVKKK